MVVYVANEDPENGTSPLLGGICATVLGPFHEIDPVTAASVNGLQRGHCRHVGNAYPCNVTVEATQEQHCAVLPIDNKSAGFMGRNLYSHSLHQP